MIMITILFAAGAYLLLLPLLKFIPIKLAVKQKVIISSLAFGITILSVIGGEFLPQISVIALLILLTGLTFYFVGPKLQKRTSSLQSDPQPESMPSAVRHHKPINYKTIDENLTDDQGSEPNQNEGLEESFIAEEQDGYIKELGWEDIQPGQYVDDEILNLLAPETISGEDEFNVSEDRIPEISADTDSIIEQEEEEEYNRLFSGMER
jgi:hypothetical protein